MRHFPIFLDLTGRQVLVVGDGEVAERKAAPLQAAGAVIRLRQGFEAADLDGCVLAVGADAPIEMLEARSREAQSRPCRLEVRRLKEATEWMERYRRFWDESFDRLGSYLQEMKATKKEKKNAHG